MFYRWETTGSRCDHGGITPGTHYNTSYCTQWCSITYQCNLSTAYHFVIILINISDPLTRFAALSTVSALTFEIPYQKSWDERFTLYGMQTVMRFYLIFCEVPSQRFWWSQGGWRRRARTSPNCQAQAFQGNQSIWTGGTFWSQNVSPHEKCKNNPHDQ